MAANNWVSQQVQSAVAGAGSMAGGVIHGVGNGVAGAGRSVGDVYVLFSCPRVPVSPYSFSPPLSSQSLPLV